MAKRTGRKRKQKPVTLAHVTIVEIETDNPMYSKSHAEGQTNPRKIISTYNAQESYVGFLYAGKHITEGEKRAADIVRMNFERLGGAGAQAIDYGKEPVDGGGAVQDITDRQMLAGQVMREIHTLLGPAGHDLTLKLAGQGLWPRDMAPRDKRKQEYLSMRFRECLEHIAVEWGFQNRVERQQVRA